MAAFLERNIRHPLQVFDGFPCDSAVKNTANAGDGGSIPGWRRFLKKEMATHYILFAWEIPWTEEPDGLQSMGS